MGESYYDVLEVEPDATPDEIESAYRDRVLESHPDHSDAPDAAERFQRVQTAKSVLTDGAERARYDRLGHEAYVGLAGRTPADDSDADDETDVGDADGTTATDRATADRTSATSTGGTTSGAATGTGGTTTANGRRTGDRTDRTGASAADGATGRTSSHHARQRSRRRQQRATRRAAGDWPFDGGGDDVGTSSTETDEATGETADERDAAGVEYSVHDWDGEVDLEWEGPSIDRSTAMTVGAVALLYPLFVAASLTPLFPLPVNAVVAACTVAVIGYLLTMPRLAIAAFGTWSVLFPVGIVRFSPVDPVSVIGLLALAFAWVPLGHAIALWWVLRP